MKNIRKLSFNDLSLLHGFFNFNKKPKIAVAPIYNEGDLGNYSIKISDDIFVHFGPYEALKQIQKDGFLKSPNKNKNFAVSLEYGSYWPSHQNYFLDDAYYSTEDEEEAQRRIEETKRQYGAIIFVTDSIPIEANPIEVKWDVPVKILDSQIVSFEQGVNYIMISNLPQQIKGKIRRMMEEAMNVKHKEPDPNIQQHIKNYEIIEFNELLRDIPIYKSRWGNHLELTPQYAQNISRQDFDFIMNNKSQVLKTIRKNFNFFTDTKGTEVPYFKNIADFISYIKNNL